MAVAERFQGANAVDAGRLSPYWGEHAARYLFAMPYIEDKTVLDIACGTGYGIGLMRAKARFAVGVDVDPEAVRAAKAESHGTAAVLLGDGLQLPFADETFDVITSFETLEHLNERREFLVELRRVLNSGGKLILSTPNADYTKPINGKPSNPYHVHEYLPIELTNELTEYFSLDTFVGQRLETRIRISPFWDAQQRLPKDVTTQIRLFGWRAFNKIPFSAREALSEKIWGKPFYPTEADYDFEQEPSDTAPVLVAVCTKS